MAGTLQRDGAEDAVDQHLNPDHRQDQPHDARDDVQSGLAQKRHQALAGNEKQVGDQAQNRVGGKGDDHFQDAPVGGEAHRRRDGAWTAEDGDRQGRDGDLFLVNLSRSLQNGALKRRIPPMGGERIAHPFAAEHHAQASQDRLKLYLER